MMRYSTTTLVLLLLVAAAPSPTQGQTATGAARAAESDTIRVAPPTGVAETDRASIVAALEKVQPGGTVQFAPGTYLVGRIMLVPQSGITLQAHPSGTTLRGCHPGEAGESVLDCGVMLLQGGGVTLRGFTIEQSQLGVCVSDCRGDPQAPVGDTVGGYRIEDNTFRNSLNGVRGQVVSSDTSVIRDNRFINTFHAVSFLEASNLHVVDNRISAPAPAEMPGLGHVSFAITVSGSSNLIARNRIEAHPDGILLGASPGYRTSGNAIRENTIAVARHRLPDGGSPALASSDPADSTIVGVPLALHGLRASSDTIQAGRLSDNLIQDNRILGAEGIGIELTRASGNRIVGNQVSGIVPRRPFPGNSVSTDPEPWRDANGSGIWVSPGSDGNEIDGNTFEDVAGAEVFLEGDRNRVRLRSADDEVRDLGTGNEVTAAVSAGSGGRSYRQPSASPITTGTDATVAPDTSEVLDAAEAFLDAFNRLEWEPFHAAFSPAATVFQPFGEPFRNDDREEIAAFFRPFFEQVRAARDGPLYLDIVPEDLRIDPLGEAAVVTFHLSGDTEVGRRTLVFDRDEGDGSWRIAHLHASSLERPVRNGEAAARQEPSSNLLELNREILRRMIEERDPELLQDVALDEFLVVAPGGRVETLSQAAAGVESFSADATIEITDEQVVRHGETAVVIGKLVIDGEMRPVGRLPPMKFTTVFVRAGDRWRLLARSLTPCFEIAIEHGFC